MIGDRAFCDCINLYRITIPCNVDYIGWAAFENCYQLDNIYFESDVNATWKMSERYWDDYNGYSVSVDDPSTNATYFTSTYCYYYWYKSW